MKMEKYIFLSLIREDRMRFGNTCAQKQTFGLVLLSPFTIFAKISLKDNV